MFDTSVHPPNTYVTISNLVAWVLEFCGSLHKMLLLGKSLTASSCIGHMNCPRFPHPTSCKHVIINNILFIVMGCHCQNH